MKKTTRILSALMALTLALGLAACSSSGAKDSQAPQQSASQVPNSQEPAKTVYKVGICQLAPHVALDAATKGFRDALVEAFGEDGVKFDEQNAAGDSATCGTIVNGFVSGKVDLILANATPALQAAASATGDIPVLGTAVTEYGVALGLEGFSGTVGTNVSGTSDLAPLDEQAQMIKDWCPEAKTVGLLYCSAEPNSKYQVDTIQTCLEKLGYTCTQYSFSDTNDMASVTQNAADNCDVLYVPTDNTIANNVGIVDNICNGKVPVFAGEEGICAGCGVATLSISYYDLGYATGEMAYEILVEGADVSTMEVRYAPQFTKEYNAELCELLGVTVPDGYTAIAE